MVQLLVKEEIHPVVKTAILVWLQEINYNNPIEVSKWGRNTEINPYDMEDFRHHTLVKQIFLIINELEQKNPTLYRLLEKLLYHYIYVKYPMLPLRNEAGNIALALKAIGANYLNMELDVDRNLMKVDHYIEDIERCEALYSSIIEEN